MKKHISRSAGAAVLVAVPIGAGLGVLLCTLLLMMFSLVFVKLGGIPDNAAPITASLSGALSAFAAGWFAAKLCGSKGLITGAASGALLFLFICAGSICCGADISLPALLIKLAVFTLCAAAGGVVRVNKRVKVQTLR